MGEMKYDRKEGRGERRKGKEIGKWNLLTENFVLPNILSIGIATLYSRSSVQKRSLELDTAR